jgi:hypothetical protein
LLGVKKILRMKIRLTENQYKRLLKENDTDFLNGMANFAEIGNKINKFIARLFITIDVNENFPKGIIERDRGLIKSLVEYSGGFSKEVATLLAYNYVKYRDLIEKGEVEELIGLPLEFYGEFSWNGTIPVMAFINGQVSGAYSGHATSPEEFYEKMLEGDYEDVDDEGYDVDWDHSYIDWDIDHDWVGESLGNQLGELDKDDVIDDIELK